MGRNIVESAASTNTRGMRKQGIFWKLLVTHLFKASVLREKVAEYKFGERRKYARRRSSDLV